MNSELYLSELHRIVIRQHSANIKIKIIRLKLVVNLNECKFGILILKESCFRCFAYFSMTENRF